MYLFSISLFLWNWSPVCCSVCLIQYMTIVNAQQILIKWLNKLVLALTHGPFVSRSPFTHILLENYRVLIRKCLYFAKLIWQTLFPWGHSFLTCKFLPVHWFFFLNFFPVKEHKITKPMNYFSAERCIYLQLGSFLFFLNRHRSTNLWTLEGREQKV